MEGFHGEAKTWYGLARAVRRGLANIQIQAYLTAAAINLKRLAAGCLLALRGVFADLLGSIRGRSQTASRRVIAGRPRDQLLCA